MEPISAALLMFALRTLPWIIGGLGVVAVVTWSPLGRALFRFLHERSQEAALNRQLVDELLALRSELGEALERLDLTERRLSQLTPGPEPRSGRGPVAELPNPDRIITPH